MIDRDRIQKWLIQKNEYSHWLMNLDRRDYARWQLASNPVNGTGLTPVERWLTNRFNQQFGTNLTVLIDIWGVVVLDHREEPPLMHDIGSPRGVQWLEEMHHVYLELRKEEV